METNSRCKITCTLMITCDDRCIKKRIEASKSYNSDLLDKN